VLAWPIAEETSSSEAPADRLRLAKLWRVAWYHVIDSPCSAATAFQWRPRYSAR
jgi:hypothetical protein